MKDYENILVALDISNEAKTVLHRAISIADKYNSQITLIHVIEPIVVDASVDLIPTFNIDIENSLVERAENYLSELSAENSLENAEKQVLIGSTKHEIHSAAKERNIDLIVMGTHGRHGVARLLGSTASAVLHGAPCDVLTVKIT